MEGVANGSKRLVIGPTERGLDLWSRILPGRPAVSNDEGWLGRLVRSSIRLGLVLTRGQWVALVAGVALGLEIGLNAQRTARL